MNITSKERTKKYRQNKKLKELNQQIRDNDILRGEKLTNKRDGVILRENIKLKGNEPKTRYKFFISQLIRHQFGNSKNCYFFTLCYRYGFNAGHIANASVIDRFKNCLIDIGAVQSMIIIPEYHSTRFSVHNHGIIQVPDEFRGDIETELKKLWVDLNNGSLYVTSLDANRKFEDYLTKFVEADKSRLFNFSDGLVTEGISFNAIPEMKIPKAVLVPVIPKQVRVNLTLITPVSEENVSPVATAPESDTCALVDVNNFLLSPPPLKPIDNVEKLQRSKFFDILLSKTYYWYSVVVLSYLNFVMRV